MPPYSAIRIYFTEKDSKINEFERKELIKRVDEIEQTPLDKFELPYLIEQTEAHWKEKAIWNAIIKSYSIYEDKPQDVNTIPDIITKALQTTIDTEIGHDYWLDADKQLEFYHSDSDRFLCHLKTINKVIGHGFKRKTLNVFLGQPKAGKSRMLLDLSVNFIKQGLDVLYVTLELSEKDVRQRADANLMDVAMDDFVRIDREKYKSKLAKIKKEINGHLIIKEYATGEPNIHVIENLYKEVIAKKNIKPAIVVVDHLTCMRAAANLGHESGNSYQKGKAISEELRAFAMKNDIILLTAGQLNKGGWNIADVEMSHIAESAAIAGVCDFMAAISATKEMLQDKKIFFTVIANRLASRSINKFMLGFDDTRMRHFDVAYEDIPEATPDRKDKRAQEKAEKMKSKFNDFTF